MIVAIDINEVWDWVKPKIQSIIDRDGYHGYTADEVRFACNKKEAFFWTTDKFGGFIVTRPKVDDDRKPVLFVWVGWNAEEDKYLEHMKELAQGIGAHRIEFHSTRKGFERKGWQLYEMIYRMEV